MCVFWYGIMYDKEFQTMENKLNLNINIIGLKTYTVPLMTFTTWFSVTAIMHGSIKYILFYYLKLTSYDLSSPTTVLWQNSHQKSLFATMKKLRYVWYPCSLWASLVASFSLYLF